MSNARKSLDPEYRVVRPFVLCAGKSENDGVTVGVVKRPTSKQQNAVCIRVIIDGEVRQAIMSGYDALCVANNLQAAAYRCGEGI